MSQVSAMSLAVLRRFAEFLDELPEDQVADLAEGRARLSYIPWGATEPVLPKAPRKAPTKRTAAPKADVASVLSKLEVAPSRDEGRALLEPMGVGELRALATAAGMTGVTKTPKADLIEQIVALTIGGRMSFAAMQDL